MEKRKMFKNKYFPTIIYLGVIISLLVITFNFMDILEKSNTVVTGNTISEHTSNFNLGLIIKEKIISNPNMPYYIYNIILIMLFIVITAMLMRFIYKIKI